MNVHRRIEALIAEGIFPGAHYVFFENGQTDIFQQGITQIHPYTKTVDSPIYDLASLTKVIGTTTLVMKLFEEGRLNFDDKISDYLPDYQNKQVSIRHLLTHTSGIAGYIPNRHLLSGEALANAILHLPVGRAFEDTPAYSDTNFIILGLLIEKILNIPVQKTITEKVLQPLFLSETTFEIKENQIARVAPTEVNQDGKVLKGIVHDPKARQLKDRCGSAGLFGTLLDCFKYIDRMVSVNPFLSTETKKLFLMDQTPNQMGNRTFGWDFYQYKNERWLFHTGYTGTFILIHPETKRGITFLSNRIHPVDNRALYLEKRKDLIINLLETCDNTYFQYNK